MLICHQKFFTNIHSAHSGLFCLFFCAWKKAKKCVICRARGSFRSISSLSLRADEPVSTARVAILSGHSAQVKGIMIHCALLCLHAKFKKIQLVKIPILIIQKNRKIWNFHMTMVHGKNYLARQV